MGGRYEATGPMTYYCSRLPYKHDGLMRISISGDSCSVNDLALCFGPKHIHTITAYQSVHVIHMFANSTGVNILLYMM